MDQVKRKKVYTPTEKEYLLICVDKYKSILESKKTNSGITNAVKNLTWDKLTREFNALPGVSPCSSKQLHDLYKNMKRRATSNSGNERVTILKTGGGPSEESTTPTDQRLINLGVVRKPLPSKEDSEGFLELEINCERNVTIPCIDPSAMITATENSEGSNAATSGENATNINEDINEQASIPQLSSFGSRLLTSFGKSQKRREPSSVKAAIALKDQSAARRVQIEEQNELVKKKLKLEIENQEASEKRAQEHHQLSITTLKSNVARALREEERAEELHAAKLQMLLEKKVYYQRKFQ